MHYLTFLILSIIQAVGVIHAMKHHYHMSYILKVCMFPVAGALVHAYLHFMPLIKNHFLLKQLTKRLKRQPCAESEISSLYRQIHNSPNYEDTYQLIEKLLLNDNATEAYQLLLKSKKGIYKNCHQLQKLKANIELKLGFNEEAFSSVKEIISQAPNNAEIQLLLAQTLEANFHHEAAAEEYKKILSQSYSFEVHYHYIHLLTKMQQFGLVREEMVTLVNKYKQLNPTHKRMHKKWVSLANQIH